MMARIVVALVVCALSSILLAQSATITSPEARLKAAMQLERVDGNLPGAIKEYQVIVTAYSKTHPAVTATALLQLGDLYRQIADSRATETYRRIVRDYANHKEAATARTRLAATTNDLWWIPLEGDARQIDLGVTNLLESGIAVHPNGDEIAFAVGEIPSAELRVFTLAAPRGQPAAGRSGR